MIYIVTGKTGVGKTTILKKSNIKNTIYLDDYVKDKLYKRWTKLYKDIKSTFGPSVVKWNKVNTSELGKIVFNDSGKLQLLNSLVKPYIDKLLKNLQISQKKYLVEMAIYINHEDSYKNFIDKVILIDRPVVSENKFKYLDKFKQPISNKEIKYDLLINHKNLPDASDALVSFVNSQN